MHSEPVDAPDGSMLGHNLRVEATEAHVKDLEAELERIKKELLAAHIERDRAKEEAYKAMKGPEGARLGYRQGIASPVLRRAAGKTGTKKGRWLAS